MTYQVKHLPTVYPAVLPYGLGYKHGRLLAICASPQVLRKPLSYFASCLGVCERQARRILDVLIEKGLIVKTGNQYKTNQNEYHQLWLSQREIHGCTKKVKIISDVADSTTLTDKAKLAYADMLSLATHNDNDCPYIELTNEQLSNRYKCSQSSIKLWLRQLKEEKLVTIVNSENGKRTIYIEESFDEELEVKSQEFKADSDKISEYQYDLFETPDTVNDDIVKQCDTKIEHYYLHQIEPELLDILAT